MTDTHLTPKQETFCQKYIENGGNASEAYRASYKANNMKNEAIWVEASRLMDNPTVSLRINELKELHLQRHNVTVDSLIEELQEARQMARELAKPETMISATMGKAKIAGIASDSNVNLNAIIHLADKDRDILNEYAKTE